MPCKALPVFPGCLGRPQIFGGPGLIPAWRRLHVAGVAMESPSYPPSLTTKRVLPRRRQISGMLESNQRLVTPNHTPCHWANPGKPPARIERASAHYKCAALPTKLQGQRPRKELNLDRPLRRRMFYPLNYAAKSLPQRLQIIFGFSSTVGVKSPTA